MKKFSFGVALVVSALLIGCQESNNPINSNHAAQTMNKAKGNPDGIIEVKQVVNKGISFESAEEYEINAVLRYSLVPFGEGQPETYTFSVASEASVQALFGEQISGKGYAESMQDLYIPSKSQTTWVESFVVPTPGQGLRVFFELNVTGESVELVSVQIDDELLGGINAK